MGVSVCKYIIVSSDQPIFIPQFRLHCAEARLMLWPILKLSLSLFGLQWSMLADSLRLPAQYCMALEILPEKYII